MRPWKLPGAAGPSSLAARTTSGLPSPTGRSRACSDPERVGRYWPSDQHNVGIACGPSRLVVVDLDTHGHLPEDWRQLPGIRDGRDVLAQLAEWAGKPWPSTYMVATANGGWHLYFTAPEASGIRNSASLLGPLVDVRGAGGYVVAAGSRVDGKPYETARCRRYGTAARMDLPAARPRGCILTDAGTPGAFRPARGCKDSSTTVRVR